MEKDKLGELIYEKVTQKMDLTPLTEFEDLETIVTADGREVGTFRAYTAPKVKKFSIAQFSIAPRMDYINRILLEREPERKMVEKAFGKELTERLGLAMT